MESEILERHIAMLKDSQLIALREFSDIEYNEYVKCKSIILDFENRHQLFEGININFNNYVNYLCSIVEEHSTKHMMSSFEEIHSNLNALILNFLSSCRALLDRSEKLLINKFGEKSNEIRKFKEFRHQEFDNKFSYKFLYGLRDYCQHRSIPNLRNSIEVNSQSDGGREYRIKMLLSKEMLLNDDDKWKSHTKKAISLQPEEFDINPLMLEHYESLKSAYIVVIKLFDFDKILESKSYINSLLQISDKEGTPCIATGSFSSEKLNLEIEHIPINIIGKIEMVETWLKT